MIEKKVKLDIGAGDYPWGPRGGGDGWTTVDLYKEADIKADMAQLPFQGNTVDEIFCSHALEHCTDIEHARRALAEWHRVLKVGGKVSIFVPNLDWCAKHWLNNPSEPKSLAFIFGMRNADGEVHRCGWNPKTLRIDLHEAGFIVEELRLVDTHGQESIFAKCSRPAERPTRQDVDESVYRNSADTVLVACPTYKGKSYCLGAYIEAYNNFMYPKRGLYMVDNTPTGDSYTQHLKSLNVACERIAPEADFQATFAKAWQAIVDYAVKEGWEWIASIEQDNICPPITLDTLLNIAAYCKAVHVAHSYPWHKSQASDGRLIGLGCNLIKTELLQAIFAQEQWHTNAIESEIFEYPKVLGIPSVEVHNILEIKHLDDDKKAEFFAFARRGPLPRMGAPAAEAFPRPYNKERAAK